MHFFLALNRLKSILARLSSRIQTHQFPIKSQIHIPYIAILPIHEYILNTKPAVDYKYVLRNLEVWNSTILKRITNDFILFIY